MKRLYDDSNLPRKTWNPIFTGGRFSVTAWCRQSHSGSGDSII